MALDLLKPLGIPRIRIWGLSVFNFLGTFLVCALLLWLIPWLNDYFNLFELCCLSIPIAVSGHYWFNDVTPLVKLVINETSWYLLMILLTCVGIFKLDIFKFALLVNFIIIIYQRTTLERTLHLVKENNKLNVPV